MKLVLKGHDERYVVEQSLMNLFPGELPVYEPILPEDHTWAVISLREEGGLCHVTVELSFREKATTCNHAEPLSGTDFEKEGQRRHTVGAAFFLAARSITGATPPWGMLTGVRPDKPVTWALAEGKTPAEAKAYLENHYFVTPERAALALETGTAALTAAQKLGPRDIAVYIGIPFCPTRCAYCSFVSHSVERSFSLVPPYVESLIAEIRSGGAMVRQQGLTCRALYMGGGTPTTLTAQQMDNVLTAFEEAFDMDSCEEITVEAGRPDTITAEKMAVLKAHGVTRVSVNPQTMEDHVLAAIGRPHPDRSGSHGTAGSCLLRFPKEAADREAASRQSSGSPDLQRDIGQGQGCYDREDRRSLRTFPDGRSAPPKGQGSFPGEGQGSSKHNPPQGSVPPALPAGCQ